jgi:cell volume regulation protein A
VTIEHFNIGLLVASAVLLIAVAAVRLASRSGLPSLLLYLALGLVIGERGPLGIEFDRFPLTAVLGYAALVAILTEGGLTTRWSTIRDAVAPAAVLATVGIVVSVAIAGAAAHLLLRLDWPMALLLGAMISSTDAAAVFSVLRRVPLPRRLVGVLEAESGFNDAPVVIAVVELTALASGHGGQGWMVLVGKAVFELAAGAVIGLTVGWLGAAGLRRVALPSSGLYPIAVIGLAVGAYAAAAVALASGFIAVYLAALVLGNSRLPHGPTVRGFAEGLGWVAQIGLFVLLGLLADPARLPEQVPPAVAIGLVLLLVARPASVLASVSWFGLNLREQAFLSWSGLRGAVPIVLTTIPVAAGVTGSVRLFDLVFVLVVIFTLLQGPSLPGVARRLRLSDALGTVDLDVETSPLGTLGADVLQVKVGPTSRLHGVEVFELRLPPGANITLVVRGADSFVPSPQTMLQHGDDLILVAPSAVRRATEERLREVSAGGKLARWRGHPPPRRRPGRAPGAGS